MAFSIRTACAVGLVGAIIAQPAAAAEPVDLLPDLVQERPRDLSIERVGTRQFLGFRSAVVNAGRGPLIIQGQRRSRAVRQMTASQIVMRDDGSARAIVGKAGVLRYITSPDHSHWHYLPFERYELRADAPGGAVKRDAKSGFCLGDRYRSEPRVPGTVAAAVFVSYCGRNRRSLTTIREGISVGWGDDYAAYLEGQRIEVTGLPPGRYTLVHIVNGGGRLLESDMSNNTASVSIALLRVPGGLRLRLR